MKRTETTREAEAILQDCLKKATADLSKMHETPKECSKLLYTDEENPLTGDKIRKILKKHNEIN